jgi:hypothetical protein
MGKKPHKPQPNTTAREMFDQSEAKGMQEQKGLSDLLAGKQARNKINIPMLLKMLVRIAAPLVVMQLVLHIGTHHVQLSSDQIDGLETYAGKAEVTKAQWRAGMCTYPMDVTYDETMDINSDIGSTCVQHPSPGKCTFI